MGERSGRSSDTARLEGGGNVDDDVMEEAAEMVAVEAEAAVADADRAKKKLGLLVPLATDIDSLVRVVSLLRNCCLCCRCFDNNGNDDRGGGGDDDDRMNATGIVVVIVVVVLVVVVLARTLILPNTSMATMVVMIAVIAKG
jgi:hypothetical protein